jgi:hypothetical protein
MALDPGPDPEAVNFSFQAKLWIECGSRVPDDQVQRAALAERCVAQILQPMGWRGGLVHLASSHGGLDAPADPGPEHTGLVSTAQEQVLQSVGAKILVTSNPFLQPVSPPTTQVTQPMSPTQAVTPP